MEFTTAPCTKARAVYELCRAAFYQPDEDRCLTHSFLGPFGADWDVASAIALIDRADFTMWDAGGHVSLSKRDLEDAAVYCDNPNHEHVDDCERAKLIDQTQETK